MDKSIFSLIEAGDSEGLARLLGDDLRAIESRTPEGLSPLIHACYQMKPQLLGQLKAAQKDFDVFEAAATGENQALSTLLAADRGLALGWSPDGFTALHLAAFFSPAGSCHSTAGGRSRS